jgi:hypothetical protein
MRENEEIQEIDNIFERILGITPPKGFGEPFTTAFSRLYHGEREEIAAAAYTCSLFLSAMFEEYSTAKLHTFVHRADEACSRFSFNCNMYETIFSRIESETLKNVCLLGGDNRPKVRECSKEDIFEAFDFYTNR